MQNSFKVHFDGENNITHVEDWELVQAIDSVIQEAMDANADANSSDIATQVVVKLKLTQGYNWGPYVTQRMLLLLFAASHCETKLDPNWPIARLRLER